MIPQYITINKYINDNMRMPYSLNISGNSKYMLTILAVCLHDKKQIHKQTVKLWWSGEQITPSPTKF